MPSFATLVSLVLLAASDLAVAQINAPDCSLTWEWSFNTLGQNACTVAAYLMSTCNNGAFSISALAPGYSYTGPTALDGTNLCKCNTVAYNLLSACDACQGATWIPWTQYITNCTTVMPPSTFPNPVPAGTRVPQWALMNDISENLWDATSALGVGDSPEILAGSVIGGSSASTTTAGTAVAGHTTLSASRVSGSPSSGTSVAANPGNDNSSSGKKSSNTGAIAGGVAGGVVVLALIGGILLYFMRRQKPQQAPSSAYVVDPTPQPTHMGQVPQPQPSPLQPSDDGTSYVPGTPVASMKFYDPSDPTTFPGYQSVPTTPDVHVPAVPYDGSLGGNTLNGNTHNANPLGGNTIANMQTAHPAPGYHGLPTV